MRNNQLYEDEKEREICVVLGKFQHDVGVKLMKFGNRRLGRCSDKTKREAVNNFQIQHRSRMIDNSNF